ncbi:DNA primase [Nocardioides psychrotolerans]|uniref:Bifunctional DNA primase/polymerase, N-terminal n=1 Tax=Nocardioides psychrotolerans TaxID=1005945 RepID=A0A1I3QJ90_9ACTN|nr:bifunctional DNA primase/polymerase [Nocardioides psychrotolerans]GEP40111.1 DNA primase [Nocardioides psychrotolerans]SFJ33639.1 Bifunctional DNA primase/polymerase, N-terminal [Nocardioides psychrotolerans]
MSSSTPITHRLLTTAALQAFAAPDLPTAATALAQAGVPVFPCVPGGKQPLTSRGFHDASADPAQVTAWWRRWPDANLALPTGAASGLDVVDVDVHLGGNGYSAFERARSAGLVEGWSWLVRTPSTGLHAYFLRTSASEQRSWQVPGKHVDFRGDGGYIVLPPSRVAQPDGALREYELIAVAQHQPRPVNAAGLRAFLDPPRPIRSPVNMSAVGARPARLAAWVASRPEGARNHGLFWAACRMAENGHGFDAASTLLGDAASSAGLTEREALATIRSAYRFATRLGPAHAARPTRAVEAVGL